jgi:hypothetical protein
MKDHLVTAENFESRQKTFLKANSDSWLMIRPDRTFDQVAHRYPDEDARRKGNIAMKAWFEYLAAKGFFATFNSWRSILKKGQSIMVVCAEPSAFDLEFIQPVNPVLTSDFWDEFERSRVPIDHRYDYDDPFVRERCLGIINDASRALRMKNCEADELRTKIGAAIEQVKQLREWKSTPIDAEKPLPPLSEELRAKLAVGIPEIA